MSDTIVAAPVTETAPAVTPAPVVETTTPQAEQQPSAPLTKREVRQSMLDTVRARQAERAAASAATGTTDGGPTSSAAAPQSTPTVDDRGRAHAPAGTPAGGQFIPSGDATGETTPAPQGAAPATADTTAAPDGVPAGFVRIPLPEGFSRNFGNEAVVPERMADFVRWNLNNALRNADVQAVQQRAEQQVREQQDEILKLRAQVTARERWNAQVVDDGTLRRYEALKEADPDGDTAELFLDGAKAKLQKDETAEFEKLSGEEQQKRQEQQQEQQKQIDQQATHRIRQAVFSRALQSVPPEILNSREFEGMMAAAEMGTEAKIRGGIYRLSSPQAAEAEMVQHFAQELHSAILAYPPAKNFLLERAKAAKAQQDAADRQQIEAKVLEERKREEAARLAEASQLPLTVTAPSALRTGTVTQQTDGDALAGLSGPRLRKAAIQRAVARASAANR